MAQGEPGEQPGAATTTDGPHHGAIDEPPRQKLGARLADELVRQRTEEAVATTRGAAEAQLRRVMEFVRVTEVGASSAWKCDVAAKALVEHIHRCDGLLTRLGRGKCSVARGAFVASPAAPSYLPSTGAWGATVPVPADGVPHAFVLFDDGSIADCAADQFDPQLPRAWFPADPQRYRVGAKSSVWTAVNVHLDERACERAQHAAETAALTREWWH